jgi:hypothetical protein
VLYFMGTFMFGMAYTQFDVVLEQTIRRLSAHIRFYFLRFLMTQVVIQR